MWMGFCEEVDGSGFQSLLAGVGGHFANLVPSVGCGWDSVRRLMVRVSSPFSLVSVGILPTSSLLLDVDGIL
jgi:hypothetical protein